MLVSLPNATWTAGGTSDIKLDRLPGTIDGLPAHLAALNIRLAIQADGHATNATEGEELVRCIDRLVLRDRLGNVIVDMSGAHLRIMQKVVMGQRQYADPADVAAAATNETRKVYLKIPFHGGAGGVLGYRKFSDLLQPCDRFRGSHMSITWSAAALAGSSYGTLDSVTMTTDATIVPRGELVQGADLRYISHSVADSQALNVPLRGARLHTLALANLDRDHSDYTSVTVRRLNYANGIAPRAFIQSWNAETALNADQAESPETGEFVPLVAPRRDGKILDSIGFGEGVLEVELVNTNATTQQYFVVEQHSTVQLVGQLIGLSDSVYYGRTRRRTKMADKNATRIYPKKGQLLAVLGAQKLLTERDA